MLTSVTRNPGLEKVQINASIEPAFSALAASSKTNKVRHKGDFRMNNQMVALSYPSAPFTKGRGACIAVPFLAFIYGMPLIAQGQLVEPFQYRPMPAIQLSQDVQDQLARKQAGDKELALMGYLPVMDPKPLHTAATFMTSAGPGRHAFVAYPSDQCSGISMQITPVGSNEPYPTENFNGAPIVYLDVPATIDLSLRFDSPHRSCGFQFMVYDHR